MKPKRVLVVDDEPLIVDVLERSLTRAGYAVATAKDGKAAIEHVQQHAVDVVITDIVMPNADGLEVIRYVRNAHPSVGIIAMSGFNEVHLAVAAELGAANVFTKPFKLDAVLEAIGKLEPRSGHS